MQISQLNLEEARHLGRDLLKEYRDSEFTFEEISQVLVRDLYQFFRTVDGVPEFALLRVFRTMDFAELTPELQMMASTKMGRYLALTGSIGIKDEWCSRQQSRTRQVLRVGENMSPMFKGVFHELGFSWGTNVSGSDEITGDALKTMGMVRYFHVPDVKTSSYITDQRDFVRPYDIRSTFASGTQFISGEAYVLIGFSTVPISKEAARNVSETMPFVATLLAMCDEPEQFWA